MENQKEMVEFIKWIATNVKGFEKSTPEEIVTAINGMAQSEEGKKSLQELYTQFQASKKKFQFGGIIPRMQGGGDTLRYMALRPIVTTRNGYPEQIGEDRTISRRYSTYSPGTASARREFYTEDGYARRINGNDTIWLERRPIAYTPAGNPENKEDANYVHIWEEVMPTSWLRTMFNGEPDSVEGPEFVESQQNGGTISNDYCTNTEHRTGRLRDGRSYKALAYNFPDKTIESYIVHDNVFVDGKWIPEQHFERVISKSNPADTTWTYRIPYPFYHNLLSEPIQKIVTSNGYNNMIMGSGENVNMGDENAKKVRDQINNIFERLNLKK